MTIHRAEIGVRGGPIGHCPECGSERLLAIANDWETNFLCEECDTCWDVSFGRVSRVDPLSCPRGLHVASLEP